MRRINLILLILVAITCTCNAQNIEGDWMSDSLFANHGGGYFFEEDNIFTYATGGYDGLSRTCNISGKYEIKKDTIYFIVSSIEEFVGGELVRRSKKSNKESEMELYWKTYDGSDFGHRPIPSTSNYWEFINAKFHKIDIEPPKRFSASFKYYKNKAGHEIIEIDGDKFYYTLGAEEFGEQIDNSNEIEQK